MPAAVGQIKVDVPEREGEAAAARHRVAGIEGEIDEHLLDLALIGLHPADPRGAAHDQLAILAQEAVPVLPGDTEETLHERIKQVERRLYPETIKKVIAGELP
jgi:hypothetical protein